MLINSNYKNMENTNKTKIYSLNLMLILLLPFPATLPSKILLTESIFTYLQ